MPEDEQSVDIITPDTESVLTEPELPITTNPPDPITIQIESPALEYAEILPEPVEQQSIPEETPATEQMTDKSPTPAIVPPPPEIPTPEPPISLSDKPQPIPIPEPQVSNVESQILEADIVASLTDEQLKSAAALYAKKNQKSLSSKGVQARQATAAKNLSAITTYVANHSPTSGASIARALNLPPRRVQHYMQILTHNGTVTATGWAQSRKYSKNN